MRKDIYHSDVHIHTFLFTSPRLFAPFIIMCCLFGVGCDEFNRSVETIEIDAGVVTPLFAGSSLGEACNADVSCRRGLACQSGVCEVTGETEENEPCLRTDECLDGLKCGWAGFCVPTGVRLLNEACGQDGECERGAICEQNGGIAGRCVLLSEEGADLNEPCESKMDCAEGLTCSAERGVCLPGSLLLNPDAFRGVACDSAEEALMPFGVRHMLPHKGADFFSLPFPNDLRRSNGHLDLRDYPVPGRAFSEKDLFDQMLRYIESIRSGWSRNPGIYFRFTRPVKEDELLTQMDRHLRLIDLTTGDSHPFTASFMPQRNKYICENALHMHPLWSNPLTGGHTYAAIVLKSVRSEENERPEQLDALSTLLASQTPIEEVERVAWQRYAPLRSWLRDASTILKDDVIGATVFTVRDETLLFEKGREAVYSADVPRFEVEPILCQEGTRSPCAQEDFTLPAGEMNTRDPRDCPERPNPTYHEIHTKIRLPIFQQGEVPYAEQGGDIRVENSNSQSNGRPQLKEYTSICMAITIPKNVAMPQEGWPVMIYGHGTNGRFRSGAQLLGAGLSSLTIDDQPTPVATIAIDQVMHGDRLGPDQTLASGPLFFNIRNPKAARGNLIQGALDNFAIVRFIRESPSLRDFRMSEIDEDQDIRFNQDQISYHGHSQGGTTGPLFAPFEDQINGVAFSGTGGGILFSLIGKKEPYDATLGLRLTLQELMIDELHPALHMFQELFDDVDPINFADRLYTRPHGAPIHGLHIMGLHDAFTPDKGQRAYAAATGGLLAKSNIPPLDFDPILDLGVVTAPYPIQGNVRVGDVGDFTGVSVQYQPARNAEGVDLYDGHFVTYRDRIANRQLLRYIGELSQGLTPTLIEDTE